MCALATPSFATMASSSGFCTSTVVFGRVSNERSTSAATGRNSRALALSDVKMKPRPASALSFAIGRPSAAIEPRSEGTSAT